MNILFMGAHPDDLEALCGGTIARCVAAGHKIWMSIATNGNVGSPTHTKTEIAAIRKQEAINAANVLRAEELIWMDEDDELLFDDRRTRLLFVDAIRKARADIVVTLNPQDYHPDHVACSKLATDARILSAVRLIDTEQQPLASPPELFYMDSVAGINFLPQFHVDITACHETKLAALLCHDSQNAWLKKIFDQDLKDLVEIHAKFRGLQAGVTYAESYSQPTYWPKRALSLPFLK